jgi:MATE family multidrug resistance protein
MGPCLWKTVVAALSGAERTSLQLELLRLAMPVMLHGLVATVVFFTDRLLLGNYSRDAIGSMGISGPLLWSVFTIFSAYGPAIVALVGRAHGAGDRERARATTRGAMIVAMLMGVGVALTGWFGAEAISNVLAGTSTDSTGIREQAASYIRVVSASAPLYLVAMALGTAMQASGNTVTPMIAGITAGVVNLVVSWVLIFGHFGAPQLGVLGAALGSVCAFVAESVVLFLALGTARSRHLLVGPVRPGLLREQTVAMWPLAWPVLGERAIFHAAFTVYTAQVGHLGPVALAAHQAVIAVESISFIAADAFGIAAGALTAQKLGAGRPDQARSAARFAVFVAVTALAVIGLIFAVFPAVLVSPFSREVDVNTQAATALLIAAFAQPVMAFCDAVAGILRGAGDTRTPMLTAIAGPLLIRISACYVLAYPMGLGLAGIWIGTTIDWYVRALWLGTAFYKERWLHLKLRGAATAPGSTGHSEGA